LGKRKMGAMRAAITFVLLTLVACGGSGSGGEAGDDYIDNPPLWNEYVIGYAETINLAEGVSIEFTAVEQDTRCPTNVQCVDQGNAQILLTTFTPRGQLGVRLNTNNTLPINAVFDSYGVELRNLDPKPTLDAQTGSSVIPVSAYEARVFVIKAYNTPPPGPY
jgi:hypothetical protein